LVSERDNRWQLIVWNRRRIAYCERYDTDDAALDRADDLWHSLAASGWSSEPIVADEPYRRACLNCQRRNVVITERQHPDVTLFCTACSRQWHDHERDGSRDRRAHPREADRRIAA
jgi:hypothetical protein